MQEGPDSALASIFHPFHDNHTKENVPCNIQFMSWLSSHIVCSSRISVSGSQTRIFVKTKTYNTSNLLNILSSNIEE